MDTLVRAKPYIPPESKEWILDKFDDILTTGGLIQGKYVAEFEEKIKKELKVDNAVATTSCGTGLETVLMASGSKGLGWYNKLLTFDTRCHQYCFKTSSTRSCCNCVIYF
jgi:dTDP-4-amino-4,6-dideoxygalactose transaminase